MRTNNKKQSTSSKWLNIAFKAIVVIFLVYLFIKLTTPVPPISTEAKRKLDSLESSIKTLKAEQLRYDVVIYEQTRLVDSLNRYIDSAKVKTTIIREYYHETSVKVDSYNPTQIDSFFKQRYGY